MASDRVHPLYISPDGNQHYHHPLHMIFRSEQHAERLQLARVDAPHTCDFCCNITIDF